MLSDLLEAATDLARISYIELHRHGLSALGLDLARQPFEGIEVAGSNCYTSPGCGKRSGKIPANAFAGAGHKGDPPVEAEVRIVHAGLEAERLPRRFQVGNAEHYPVSGRKREEVDLRVRLVRRAGDLSEASRPIL